MRLQAGTLLKVQGMLPLANFTRSSAYAKGPRDVPQIRNIALEKTCNNGMTFKDTEDAIAAIGRIQVSLL